MMPVSSMAAGDDDDVSVIRIGTDAYGVISYESEKSQSRIIDLIEIEDDDDIVEVVIVDDDDQNGTNRSPSKRIRRCRRMNRTTPLLKPLFAVQKPLVPESPSAPEPLELPCKYCAKVFYGKNEFQLHELDHFKSKILKQIEKKRRMLPCHTCGDKLATRSALEWHMAECKGKVLAKRAGPRLTRSRIHNKRR